MVSCGNCGAQFEVPLVGLRIGAPPIITSMPQPEGSVLETLKQAGGSFAAKALSLGRSGAELTADIGKKAFAVAADVTHETVEIGKQAYAGSKLESTVNILSETTGAAVDKLDQVTGRRLVELLEEKLSVQDTYNDVLATRLAEALERITRLESDLVNSRRTSGHAE